MQTGNHPSGTPTQQFKFIRRQLTIFRRHNISIFKQAIVVVAASTFVLYSVLFTNLPTIHNFFHGLRHALGIIPCH